MPERRPRRTPSPSIGHQVAQSPREEPSAGNPHARLGDGKAKWLRYSTTAPQA
jgi:hypothetical protein